jgi:hypothetical protein
MCLTHLTLLDLVENTNYEVPYFVKFSSLLLLHVHYVAFIFKVKTEGDFTLGMEAA